MELLQDDRFYNLFSTFRETAFHLEVEDSYSTPEESGPFGCFLRGKPDDYVWHQPWLQSVREATAAGKRINRVRVVTVPHGDYTRWGLTVAPLNIDAGEDIRWLPRDRVDPTDLTADDFWLFDNSRVVFTVFEPNGRFAGGAATTDSTIVNRCREVHHRVWKLAITQHRYECD